MVVLVNHTTRFTVLIYGVKGKQIKNIESRIPSAIRNTMASIDFNAEVIEAYLNRAGDISYIVNHDRKITAQLNRLGLESAIVIGRTINSSFQRPDFEDTYGSIISKCTVNCANKHDERFVPLRKMREALASLANKPVYKYRAFELLVTLDLEIYQATRRLIVPANITFIWLHDILQSVYYWENRHLYDFTMYDDESGERCVCLVPDEESLSYDVAAVLIDKQKLSNYFPKYKSMIYTYDMGDDWQHKVELIRIIEEYNEESPYLLEAVGKTPPEDIGGVGGYIDFYKIILNPKHPEYETMKP